MTPPWLPLPASLPGREAEIASLLDGLGTAGLVGLGGEPGVGKTTLAGAVARASGRPLLAVSLAGCLDEADVARAIGAAAGTLPAGDERATIERLSGRPGLLLVVDDVPNEAAAGPLERLVAELPEARALLVSERPLVPRHLPIDDPSGAAPGTTFAAELCAALGVGSIEAALAALPPEAQWLAAFPAGLPAAAVGRLPAVLLRPDAADRVTLRRAVAARLPAARPGITEPLRRALQPLLDLARGAHLTAPPDPRDVLVLRALAAAAPDPTSRAELVAAECRCLLAFGQAEAAGTRLAATDGGGFAGEALLAFAKAELAFTTGDVDAAWSMALAAAEAQGAAGDPAARAVTWRRVAERLAERGEVERADEAWRRARQASRLLGDDGGLAAAMRGAAALALSRGEWVGASALHEEAAETLPPAAERANLRLSELTLALVRGESARLRRGLDALEEAATDDALLAANLARRRADAALRQGDSEGARTAADRAAALYAALGEPLALGHALRLGGDATALAGELAEAHTRYERALRQQVRTRDWAGIIRTLDHAALVAESAGEVDRARHLREQRAAAQRARGLQG